MKTFLNRKAQRAAKVRNTVDAAIQLLEKRVLLSVTPFQPGDFVIYQVGSGSAALNTAAAPVFIDEYTPSGTLVQSFQVGGGSGLDSNPLTAAGSATSEGNLTLSSNGQYLLLPGYDNAPGVANIANSTAAVGEIARIDSQGNIDTSTTIGNLLSFSSGINSVNVRGAASADGTNLYVSGVKGAVYTTLDTQYSAGNPGSTAVLTSTTTNLRAIEINGGQLYVDSSTPIATLGTGLPTGGGPLTPAALSGITAGAAGSGYGGAYQFAFATLNGGSNPDTLYVADNFNGGIDKYSLTSGTPATGTWVYNGEIGEFGSANSGILDAISGIIAEPVSGGEQLFVTAGTKLYTVTDPYGYNSAGPAGNAVFTPSPVPPVLQLLATAGTNTVFRGMALVPQPTTVSVFSNPGPASVPAGTNATFTSTAYGINQSVKWQVNTGSSFVDISSITGYASLYSGVTTDTLTVLNTTLAESGYTYRAVFSNTAPSSATSNPATLTVNPTPSISSLSPIFGPPAGGTSVTITGNNLAGATAVYFGTPGPSTLGNITADSAGSITVTDPAESGGAVNVTVVTTAGGSSAINSNDIFTYATTPTVAGVGSTPAPSPASGEDRGGTTVTITGTGFISGSTVTFGGVAATGVVVNSYTSITAVDPAALLTGGTTGVPIDGPVDVQVTTPLGQSAANPTTVSNPNGDTFTYIPLTNAEAESIASGTKGVTLDNSPIVTAILSDPIGSTNGVSYSNWAFLVNDGTGSIDVFGTLPSGYTPQIGDAITVTGEYDPFDSIPEIEDATAISLIPPGGSIPPQGNSIAALAPVVDTLATASVVPQPLSLAGQLVTIHNATISGVDASTFGTANLNETGANAVISDASDPSGISFFYFPTSYSAANAFFDGLQVPTAPVTMTGIIDVFNGVGEFVPISELGFPEKFTISNLTNTSSDENANDFSDGFNQVSRGSTVAVTITRTEVVPTGTTPYTDTGTIGYTLIPDSATAGTDYTDTDPSVTSAPGASTITGLLTFNPSVQTQTFNINIPSNPGDSGDKLFTIELNSPNTSNPASATNATGYLAAIASGPSTLVINDPNSQTTFSSNSLSENANIGVTGPEAVSGALTTSIVTIEANSGANTDESYAVLTFDDSSDPSDVLNTGAAFQTIDGIELEAQALPKSFDASGILDVYLVGDTLTGASPYPVASQPTSAGLNFLTSSTPVPPSTLFGDPIQGLGNQLGTKYLLGTISYNLNQVPGGYTPFNLTNLDPTGVSMLAAELTSGAPFTIAITPGDASVAATWVGYTTTTPTDEGPVLRIDYASSLPAWVNPSSAATWINPTQNLAVTGAATIVANPAASGNAPVIFAANGSSSVTTINVPSATGIVPISLGGLSLTGGASMIVDSISGTQSANHYVLDIASGGIFNIDATSQLNLMSNDAIFLGGSLSTVTASLAAGYSGGSWNGDGIMSSTAGGVKSIGVELNNNGSGGVLYGTFDGQTVTNTAVLVKYTYAGDANLDGVVNGSDYTLIDNGFNAGLSGWRNGDFDYSSAINGGDYLLIDNSFNMQGSPLIETAESSQETAPVPAAPLASAFSTGAVVSIPGASVGTASVGDGLFSSDEKSLADQLFDN